MAVGITIKMITMQLKLNEMYDHRENENEMGNSICSLKKLTRNCT